MKFFARTFNLARLAHGLLFLGSFAFLLIFIWLIAQPVTPVTALWAFPGAAVFCVMANAKHKKMTGEDLF